MRRRIGKVLSYLNVIRAVHWLALKLANWRRRSKKIDYVWLTLPSSLPMLAEEQGWLRQRLLGKTPLSLLELERLFERIADDPRPKGVILHLRGLEMSLADLQSLRDTILRLRQRGKRVVCFAQNYDTRTYYIASAADEIAVQPRGGLMTMGLRQQVTFFRDSLDAVGVQMDVVAITPYKGAFDTFTRSDPSPEGREQIEWLLDSRYGMIVEGIATGRGMTAAAVQTMIDSAPHLDDVALEAGYVDVISHEEGLAAHLGVEHLVTHEEAEKVLLKQWRKRQEHYVAVLPLIGGIIPGESARPPIKPPISLPFIGEQRLGDLTVVRQVRNLMRDKQAKAVVLYIDSPGGSADASEAMVSALHELAKDRPLVVCMGGVAGSGGYHIATPGQWIVAQPGTITGSIGVIFGKPVTGAMQKKLRFNPLEFIRGANASLLSLSASWNETQRGQIRHLVEQVYAQFVAQVAISRDMTTQAVDTIAGGRVWTGAQALENGLVDELGDLQKAVAKARQLATLPDDSPLVVFSGKGKPLGPQLADKANPAALLTYLHENLSALTRVTPQMLMPFDLD
jgi:protease-4